MYTRRAAARQSGAGTDSISSGAMQSLGHDDSSRPRSSAAKAFPAPRSTTTEYPTPSSPSDAVGSGGPRGSSSGSGEDQLDPDPGSSAPDLSTEAPAATPSRLT